MKKWQLCRLAKVDASASNAQDKLQNVQSRLNGKVWGATALWWWLMRISAKLFNDIFDRTLPKKEIAFPPT